MGFAYLFVFLSLFQWKFHVGQSSHEIRREDFPKGFVFGAGTSAYQVEGAAFEDGRTPSTWDAYTHAGNMFVESTADVSADQYHKYKEDVKLMSDMGLEAFRFSISLSRLLPEGRGAINPKGLEYYKNLINELIRCGRISQHMQMCASENSAIEWLAHWTTFNEHNIVSKMSYDSGFFPPQRCSPSMSFLYNCTGGNSSVEPYIVTHSLLLAHASAVRLYKVKYQAKHKGQIGMNVYAHWLSPYTNSTADVEAAQRALDFYIGWVINPLVFGDYPETMKKYVGSRLPSFTKREAELVKGAFDFFGLNHYSSAYVEDNSNGPPPHLREFSTDMFVKFRFSKDDTPSGQLSPFSLPVIPSGLQDLLSYMTRTYGNPPLYVQENGYGQPCNESLNDTARVDYLKGYINATLEAIRDGANVKGYIVWALLDVFEFLGGYQSRHGLYHVDFNDKERTRQPKLSAHWHGNFSKGGKEKKIQEKAAVNSMKHAVE